MNRRQFIHTILGAPLLTPLLLASPKTAHCSELYLISDHPQSYLFPLLEALRDSHSPEKKTFTFLNPHPSQEDLRLLLMRRGWSPAAHAAYSDLALSFFHLHHKACPSFSLVKNGKIRDIRTGNLKSLWLSMTRTGSPASILTVAALAGKASPLKDGHSISLYKDGAPIGHLPLDGSGTRRIPTNQGPITVRMQAGQAWIEESPCRHKICVSTPPVSMAGERIICAPNHFLLEIQGGTVDTVVG